MLSKNRKIYICDTDTASYILASEATGEDCSSNGVCTLFGSKCNEDTGQCVCDCGRKLVTAQDSNFQDVELCAPGESRVIEISRLCM